MATELKDTLLLPKTDFPMRAGLAQREPGRVAHWEQLDLYNQIQAKRAHSPKGAFVLHDGPPFTNGDVHIGTALNKTLKDIVNRYKSMRGFRTPYVPGWDCHGLPIEQKVSQEVREKKTHPHHRRTPRPLRRLFRKLDRQADHAVQAHRRPRRLGQRIQDEGARLRGRHRPHLRRLRREGPRLPQQETRLLEHPF